ncbi:MAG: hypothetical protein ACP5E5_09275 [Acidobacteriaceae bacterium]
MDILHQLGGLVLGSVPAMVFFLLLVVAYGPLVRRPLERTLAERRARTTGAVEQAHAAMAAAEAKAGEYEEKLRAARNEMLAARERKRQQWKAERDEAIESARVAAQQRVRTARQEIEMMAEGVRKQIEESTALLSDQIVQAMLPKGSGYTEARQ